ncbi:uncharacterized protein LOC131049739 isoform X2 [Cryptomeria japonica]|uniref:uncharacterized protein LOC131049739 isoform X2 n=1 Tax=Cryptomeria japonica TaxID=3369 RepID=UPI0027D9EF37|nr:uncharacterized protein LOC131049739 isoform X2 [Cryptomeria japonica]
MLLKIFSAFRPKLSPFVWISRTSASHRDHHSMLHKISSSLMFKTAFSHFHLALPHTRKPQECCCMLTEVYYQEMLKENPDNPLLLRNYAKFLHEGTLARQRNSMEGPFWPVLQMENCCHYTPNSYGKLTKMETEPKLTLIKRSRLPLMTAM